MSHLGICNHQIDEVNCNEVIKQGWLGSSKDYNFQAIIGFFTSRGTKSQDKYQAKIPNCQPRSQGISLGFWAGSRPCQSYAIASFKTALACGTDFPTCTCENGTSSLTSACSRSARPEDRKNRAEIGRAVV